MNTFIKPTDHLSTLINTKANELYKKLLQLPVHELDLAEFPKTYYTNRHINRLFFSVETASVMLYNGLKMLQKDWKEAVIMEYGAGMGSLFLLTSMIGCKTIIYEDIDPEMTAGAQSISKYLNIPINHFITGNHDDTLAYLKEHKVQCDLIISRNVIEHIYNLDDFYAKVSQYQPNAIVHFSTTANYYNPLMHIHHLRHHKKSEQTKLYDMRKSYIINKVPQLETTELESLTTATRGLAMEDLDRAIQKYMLQKNLPDPKKFYSNTCDPTSGLWYENLLSKAQYIDIIESKGYKLIYEAAFWDTHYKSALKNIVTKSLNGLTKALGKKTGVYASPFIYITAIPKKMQ